MAKIVDAELRATLETMAAEVSRGLDLATAQLGLIESAARLLRRHVADCRAHLDTLTAQMNPRR